MEIKHVGLDANRLSRELLEKAFADEWIQYAPVTLGYLIGQDYTQRDAEVAAATMIQWLGSNGGRFFVEAAQKRHLKYEAQQENAIHERQRVSD